MGHCLLKWHEDNEFLTTLFRVVLMKIFQTAPTNHEMGGLQQMRREIVFISPQRFN